jgi:hypothetical protein
LPANQASNIIGRDIASFWNRLTTTNPLGQPGANQQQAAADKYLGGMDPFEYAARMRGAGGANQATIDAAVANMRAGNPGAVDILRRRAQTAESARLTAMAGAQHEHPAITYYGSPYSGTAPLTLNYENPAAPPPDGGDGYGYGGGGGGGYSDWFNKMTLWTMYTPEGS